MITKIIKKKTGRSFGKISVRHIGGGSKKKYKIIDFYRDKVNIPAKIHSFVYDPYRNVDLALLKYFDGENRFIIRTHGMFINKILISNFNKISFNSGNSTYIKNIPIGSHINCVGNKFASKAIFARSSGSNCELLFKNNKFSILKLPSGKKKEISNYCISTFGKVYNSKKKKMYKAGQNRWKGIRPTVRGVAMNPVDHPHGGGEGKTSGGRHPCTPWGKKTKGLKTKKCRDH